MDYQKAIDVLSNSERYVGLKYVNGIEEVYVTPYFEKALSVAISSIQELREYKQLGTLEEIKLLKETHLTGVELAQISCAIKQLAEYEKIGTLEEVRDEVERNKPKKVVIKRWSPSICPRCGNELSESLGDGYYRHPTFLERCPNPDCAQRLDWSEKE